MAVIQVATPVRSAGNPLTSTLVFPAPITAGNTVVVPIHMFGVSLRTFTTTESGSGTGWSEPYATTAAASVGQSVYRARANHPGGNDTIVVTHGNSSGVFSACAIEFEAGTSIDLVDADNYVDPGVTDNHQSSSAGLTTGEAVLGLIAAGANTTLFTNGVATGSWTKIGGTDAEFFFAYQLFPSGTSAEIGAWTSTGTDRVARSAIALFGTDASVASYATGGWFGR